MSDYWLSAIVRADGISLLCSLSDPSYLLRTLFVHWLLYDNDQQDFDHVDIIRYINDVTASSGIWPVELWIPQGKLH